MLLRDLVLRTGVSQAPLQSSFGGLPDRQHDVGFAAVSVGPIAEEDSPAMSFGDLPAQRQADAGAAWLSCEERHEQIAGIGDTWAIIFDDDFNRSPGFFPRDPDARAEALRTRVR